MTTAVSATTRSQVSTTCGHCTTKGKYTWVCIREDCDGTHHVYCSCEH